MRHIRTSLILSAALLSTAAPSIFSDSAIVQGPPATRVVPAVMIDRTLMVTHLGVVEDPTRTDPIREPSGPWTFRHLIEEMAGDLDPAEFALHWLESWEVEQTVNGRQVQARPAIRQLVIEPWLQVSGGERLDLRQAPFKLLAIVNRIDLREYDERQVATAGEGRFVFGLLDSEGQPLQPIAGNQPGGFIVIFEYEMIASDMGALRHWAEEWRSLSDLTPGSEVYNSTLETITRRWTDAGAAPGKPNRVALNQIRTNEIALALPWELREFVIDDRTGLLRPNPTALTPDTIELNGTSALADLINVNEQGLLDGSFELPDQWFGGSSLSGPFQLEDFPDSDQRTFKLNPLILTFNDIPWSAAEIKSNDARHGFALNTCNGCHRDETGTNFTHIGFPEEHRLPLSLGVPAKLSGFLTGIEITDPVDDTTVRGFADLERRQEDLVELIKDFNKDSRGPNGSRKPMFVH